MAPDGVIDGLAFGLFWRDAHGGYRLIKSRSDTAKDGATFVGGWPLGLSDREFEDRAPQITDGVARQHARATLYGAELLADGEYILLSESQPSDEGATAGRLSGCPDLGDTSADRVLIILKQKGQGRRFATVGENGCYRISPFSVSAGKAKLIVKVAK